MNLPNKLTLSRIALIPILVASFYLETEYKGLITAVVFILAYLTDMLDGYIARKRNLITDFGKFMDPIADKLLTACALVFMLAKGMFVPVFGEVFVFVTIAREFIISGLRLVAAANGDVIAAGNLGKLKTILQFITLTAILVDGYFLPQKVKSIVDCSLITVTTIITLWAMIDYFWKSKHICLNSK